MRTRSETARAKWPFLSFINYIIAITSPLPTPQPSSNPPQASTSTFSDAPDAAAREKEEIAALIATLGERGNKKLLQARCKQEGLRVTGNVKDLCKMLEAHLLAKLNTPRSDSSPLTPSPPDRPASAPPQLTLDSDASSVAAIETLIAGLSKWGNKKALQARCALEGLTTKGTTVELSNSLKDHLLAELTEFYDPSQSTVLPPPPQPNDPYLASHSLTLDPPTSTPNPTAKQVAASTQATFAPAAAADNDDASSQEKIAALLEVLGKWGNKKFLIARCAAEGLRTGGTTAELCMRLHEHLLSKLESSSRPSTSKQVVVTAAGFGNEEKKKNASNSSKPAKKNPMLGRRGAMENVVALYHGDPRGNTQKCSSFMSGAYESAPCDKPVCTDFWFVEGHIGFCSKHAPGRGILIAVRAYLEKNDDTIPLSVENPSVTDQRLIKNAALNELEANIKDLIDGFRGSQVFDIKTQHNGVLYCYHNHKDPVPFDTRRGQRPLKCGKAKANQFPERFNIQRRKYGYKGQIIDCIACERFPFIELMDRYVIQRLKWWNLPSRGGDGGTEFYYISLQQVLEIWRDGRNIALEVAKRANLGLDDDFYKSPLALP